jgi:hypothetical protein
MVLSISSWSWRSAGEFFVKEIINMLVAHVHCSERYGKDGQWKRWEDASAELIKQLAEAAKIAPEKIMVFFHPSRWRDPDQGMYVEVKDCFPNKHLLLQHRRAVAEKCVEVLAATYGDGIILCNVEENAGANVSLCFDPAVSV